MTNSESFLEEVAEEVRRDRLFKFFRKYGWLVAALVLLAISASGIYEWKKNSDIARAEENGDLLSLALIDSKSGNLKGLFDLFSENSQYLNPSEDLVALTKLFYIEHSHDDEKNSDDIPSILDEIITNGKVSKEFRQLAKLKYLLFYSGDEKVRQELIDELSSPDNYYRFLAQEQRIYHYIELSKFEEAKSQIILLLNDPEVSDVQKTRLMDLKLAIR